MRIRSNRFQDVAGLVVAGLIFLTVQPAVGQDATTAEEANAHFQAQEWAEAAKAYDALTRADASNRQAWSRLAWSLYQLEDYDRALAAYLSLEQQGGAGPLIKYNIASLYARTGDTDQALAFLDQAIEAGYGNVQSLQTDDDLAAVRGDARFASLVERADRNARPCMYDERFRAFDFWVGEWNVFNPQDQLVGSNTIRQEENGCVLVEDWSGRGGSTGISMNYFDPVREEWVQVWVAASGYSIVIRGGIEDGSMRLVGELVPIGGPSTPFRGTWTPLDDGRVRQFFEQSTDGGATWQPWFDGYYVRKEQ